MTLCLNGCTLKALPYASGAVKVSAGASLTICDCGNGGKITSACSNTNPTLRVYGTCTLKSGAITVEDATASGGCAVRIDDTGVFTMTGGSLVGGKYGVYNQNVANLNGGTVSGVTAGAANESNPGRLNVAGSAIESSAGAAISLDYGSLDMTGGSASGAAADVELATSEQNNSENIVLRIAGGSAGRIVHRSDYPLYLSGEPTVTSVELASVENQLFASENGQAYNGSAITVSLQDPPEAGETVIQGILGNADKFTLQADGLYFEADDAGNLVATDQAPASGHTHGVDGGSGSQTWTAWDGTTDLENGAYYLTDNVKLARVITVSGDAHLCLNGFKIEDAVSDSDTHIVFRVEDDGSLTICDCSNDETGKVTTSKDAVLFEVNGDLTLYGGMLQNLMAKGSGYPLLPGGFDRFLHHDGRHGYRRQSRHERGWGGTYFDPRRPGEVQQYLCHGYFRQLHHGDFRRHGFFSYSTAIYVKNAAPDITISAARLLPKLRHPADPAGCRRARRRLRRNHHLQDHCGHLSRRFLRRHAGAQRYACPQRRHRRPGSPCIRRGGRSGVSRRGRDGLVPKFQGAGWRHRHREHGGYGEVYPHPACW